MQPKTQIDITLPRGGFARSEATDALSSSGLPTLLAKLGGSPFGHTSVTASVVEALLEATDLGLAAAATLEGVIRSDLTEPGSFAPVTLSAGHHRLLAAFQITITADDAARRIAERCPTPEVDGALELDGIDDLLGEADRPKLAARMLRLARAFLEAKSSSGIPEGLEPDAFAGTTVAAAMQLLRNAVQIFARTGTIRPMLQALTSRKVSVAGFPYSGLTQQPTAETPSGLLSFTPDKIVGNEEYLKAGLRLARDVAGFDQASGKNPKKVNPVLFGLGRPGCGKTVTAHAVGNYFLDYCRQRSLSARFVVVRRSDWASSYQNASASNLIRIFREEVYGFDGVCGVYWPDIDTALASRSSNDLRSEEKQNLGAVFGIFDGTLLPKDGKWFMICDANTMHMDEAAISRIAQNPFTVAGPTKPEHYVQLMRDLMLRDLRDFLPSDDAVWLEIGARAVDEDLSGRTVDAISGNIRAHIQDFEFPDEYFTASAERRHEIINRLSRPVDKAFIVDAIADWSRFRREAEQREAAERFESEVETVVRQLNAGRAAMERAAELGLTEQ